MLTTEQICPVDENGDPYLIGTDQMIDRKEGWGCYPPCPWDDDCYACWGERYEDDQRTLDEEFRWWL